MATTEYFDRHDIPSYRKTSRCVNTNYLTIFSSSEYFWIRSCLILVSRMNDTGAMDHKNKSVSCPSIMEADTRSERLLLCFRRFVVPTAFDVTRSPMRTLVFKYFLYLYIAIVTLQIFLHRVSLGSFHRSKVEKGPIMSNVSRLLVRQIIS